MHALVIAIGSTGDIHHMLGLGCAFRERGHRVTFVTHPPFQGLVERCGLRFLGVGTAEHYNAAMNNPALWNPRTSLATLWGLIAGELRGLYDVLLHECDGETVMVGSLWAFAARLVQEKHGVPLVMVQVSPSTVLSARLPPVHKRFTLPGWLPYPLRAAFLKLVDPLVLDRLFGPQLNRVRAELGMAPVSRIMTRWMHSPQGVLGLFPDWFAPPQSDWPPELRLTGFPLFDEGGLHRIDDETEAFLGAGAPPVVFTSGSTLVDGPAFYRTSLGVLRRLNRRGILLTRENAPAGTDLRDVLVRSYVPMSALLPRVAALVHHGGIGTVAQAFAAGVPQLATPFAHDQFDNAERMQRLGCGLRLDSPVEAPALTAALARLLDNPAVLASCREIRAKVEPGAVTCGRAAEFVEGLARQVGRYSGPASLSSAPAAEPPAVGV
ncbi:MAG: glycosyltransferase [Nevskia sp.]|nr:glycosyltransferase [Nevskia sp.]